uniref:Uncharacterized protein n=1 Tax=Grammatophora oceanica TaxID=210454 RepID=A0A7S1UY70_9STRA|mmetsp:Transcript_26844/g.39257  ORF Transcript_26844/g.39257 Transcript_26844/m.39257 type:complete len:242 (+) Transcript_26844:16-741(+)|eukprot:CAMPEP_0194052428 /NCGR_PEP_ID=MMETSP0009_2-20130614/45430_1 /TAXON_ID=210454 /ORGANISM="Grammatophora oceanica, Strain CCMP 410" /LENGTH=241 /DNA_ID=CAMNT_0038700003 /DNA_START=11 /DNA_END=736 /DNA_ORIENTATION=+
MGKKSGGRVRVKQVGPKGAGKMLNPMEALSGSIPPEEMITLPPKPNPNSTIVWPIAETLTMKFDRFSVIYPNYLDSKKTCKQGRRISVADSVDTPTVQDVSFALQGLKIRHAVQPNKGYSRDPESRWDNPGRVFVDIGDGTSGSGVLELDADGGFDTADMPDLAEEPSEKSTARQKLDLLRILGKIIPELPSRKQRLERLAREAEEREKQEAEQEAAAHKAASAKATGTGTKKKRGKKGRK